MKTPIDWNQIPEVASVISDLIYDAHSLGDTRLEAAFDESRNGYGENGTLTVWVDGRKFHLATYEVR